MLTISMYLDVFCFWYHVVQNQFKTIDWKKTWLTDIWYHVIHSDFKLSIEIVDTSSRFWNHAIYNDSKTSF